VVAARGPWAVGLAVHQKAAAAADALPAIVLESHRPLTGADQALIELIEHLQQRQVRRELLQQVAAERTRPLGALLAPDAQGQRQGGTHR
jgi:hypothetical protein